MPKLLDCIHTKIGPALADPSTWAGLATAIGAAAALPHPVDKIVMAISVPAVLLKGGSSSGINQ